MKEKTLNFNVPYIKKDNFSLMFPDIKPASFDQKIKYWLKTGKIIKLKRGLYIFDEYYKRNNNKSSFLEFLSSIIYSPSYISKETVLSKYGMLTEAVYGISSVTLKAPRSFISNIGVFTYSNIKEELFSGYQEVKYDKFTYQLASRAKALFDYLYFEKRKIKTVNKNAIEELRINTGQMENSDWTEFERYLKKSKSVKMLRIYNIFRKINA